jgi:hypothetical protein
MSGSSEDDTKKGKLEFLDNLILGAGENFSRHPIILMFVLFLIGIIPIFVASTDLFSNIWLSANPPPPDNKQTKVYEYSAKIAFDVFGGVLITALIILLVGYVKIRHLTDALSQQKTELKKQFDDHVKESKSFQADLSDSNSSTVKNIAAEASNEISGFMSTFVPTWTVLTLDDRIRHEIRRLSTSIAKSIQDQPIERRIITRSLLEGLVKRFDTVLSKLPKEGVIMDPEERRTLTGELFDATGSYVVIFHGLFRLRSGAFMWHDQYLDFVRKSAIEKTRQRVAWVFITDDSVEVARKNPAISEATDLGVECFIVPSFSTGANAVLNTNPKMIPERMGPLIEVFSGAFADALHSRVALPAGANLTWKATSFAKRGTKGSGDKKDLKLNDAVALIKDEGSVWFDDEIAKVIRASQDGANTSSMSKFLSYVCEARVAAVA